MRNGSFEIKGLIFDLDDTLFDTSGQILENAINESCRSMISTGLTATLQQCRHARERISDRKDRVDFFEYLVKTFGVSQDSTKDLVIQAGKRSFFQREVETNIQVFPGVYDILVRLLNRYRLFLVTLGHPATQRQKVNLLQLYPYFEEVIYVDNTQTTSKQEAFERVLQKSLMPSEAFLVVGNRLDGELQDGKDLGMRTCHIRHGEQGQNSTVLFTPDYSLTNVTDLSFIC